MLSKLEIRRQLFHIALGIIVTFLLYVGILDSRIIFLIIIAGMALSFISKYVEIPFIRWFLNMFEREEYRHKFPGRGPIFFFVGVLLAIQLFPRDIALASIMVLTFGDSISHLVGAQIGKVKNIFNGDGKKLFEGTFAGTITGFLGAVLFVPVPEAFFGALGAMIAEVVKIEFNHTELDDNLVVPLVAGTVMLIVGKLI